MLLSDRDIKRRFNPNEASCLTCGKTHYEFGETFMHRFDPAKGRRLVIEPQNLEQIQPASYDIRLGNEFWCYKHSAPQVIDPYDDNSAQMHQIHVDSGTFLLLSGEFVLGVSLEYMEIPNDIAARIEGRSSLGRLGLLVHSSAGFIDPGFKGKLTLELKNISPRGFVLTPGMRIGQLCFFQMSSAAEKPYAGRYQNQIGAVPSRYGEGEGISNDRAVPSSDS